MKKYVFVIACIPLLAGAFFLLINPERFFPPHITEQSEIPTSTVDSYETGNSADDDTDTADVFPAICINQTTKIACEAISSCQWQLPKVSCPSHGDTAACQEAAKRNARCIDKK